MAKTLTARVIHATSLLGSTQMLNMLCSVVRTKLLSYWVGPVGVGLMGVLSQSVELFSNFTQLNIRTTAVRDLAILPPGRRGETIGIVRRVGAALGWLGLILMFLAAPWLSRFFYETGDYSWAFRIAAAALLFQALQGNEHVVLQAEGRFRQIAASGLIASASGLIIALPLFFWLRTRGIAPAVVGYALASWLASAWFTRRYRSESSDLSLRECFRRSRRFIEMGFYMVVATMIGNLVGIALSAVVSRVAGDVNLGLYQAGNTMLLRYVGVFFTAIGIEFYPRLASVINRPRHASLLITHQARVSTLLFLPCAILAVLLTPWLIRLLYDADFLPMAPYFVYGMIGMALRPASVVISFGLLTANKAKPYLLTEILSSLIGFALNTAGFILGGWTGLGLSTALWYLLDLLIIYTAARVTSAPVYPPRTLALALTSALTLFLLTLLL